MKKTFCLTALVLALCAAAGAAAAGTIHVDAVQMENGSYLPNGASAAVAGRPAEGAQGYAWMQDGVLTLSGFQGSSIAVDAADLTIRLVGDNALTNTSGSALSASGSRLTVEGAGASLALKASADGDEAVLTDGGHLTFRGGDYVISAQDDCIESESGGVTIENANMTLTNTGTQDEEGIDAEDGGHVVIRGSRIVMDVPQDGIRTDGGDVRIEDSTLSIRSRMGDGVCSFGGLAVRGSRLTVDANLRAVASMGPMSLQNSALQLITRDASGLAVSAAGGLDAPGMPVISDAEDPFTQMKVFSIGDANGPFSRFVYPVHTEPNLPGTGDPTPVALLMALAALSLAGLLRLRRREA